MEEKHNKGSGGERIIRLVCPEVGAGAVSIKIIEDERVEVVELMCGLLGLDPAAPFLRINRHLVSRGFNPTWNSLLSFFASRGLPTGESSFPLVIHGNLCKPGVKRPHISSDIEDWDNQESRINTQEEGYVGKFLKKNKTDKINTGDPTPSKNNEKYQTTSNSNGHILKRKSTLEDLDPLMKKQKSKQDNSDKLNTLKLFQVSG